MLKILQTHLLKKNTIEINKRCLWQWIDDTFNRQVSLNQMTRIEYLSTLILLALLFYKKVWMMIVSRKLAPTWRVLNG